MTVALPIRIGFSTCHANRYLELKGEEILVRYCPIKESNSDQEHSYKDG